MNDVEEARKRWLAERDRYEEFGEIVALRMAGAVHEAGIACETSSRAKETHSLVKKLLKGKHTYESLSDKVGARCVVRYVSDLEPVVAIAQEVFVCGTVDRKSEGLGVEKLGYLSIHIDVGLRDDDTAASAFEGFRAELQIRTLGQHLWSEMSHDSVYKNEGVIAALPETIRRRVNLMAGLIEVADQEFDRLNKEIANDGVTLYKAMERHYFTLATRRPDPELSLEVIDLLRPLYGDASVAQVLAAVEAFCGQREPVLRALYEQEGVFESSALFSQPEVVMLYERLETDPIAVRAAWNARFPERELERAANALGISFD